MARTSAAPSQPSVAPPQSAARYCRPDGHRRHTIMEVQLAHGRGIGPARPLGLHPDGRRQSEERRPMGPRVGPRHDTSRGDRWRLIAARATPALSTTRTPPYRLLPPQMVEPRQPTRQVSRSIRLPAAGALHWDAPAPRALPCLSLLGWLHTPRLMGCAWLCHTWWPGRVACSCAKQSPEDTRQLRQHQGFVLPRDVAHQANPTAGSSWLLQKYSIRLPSGSKKYMLEVIPWSVLWSNLTPLA